MITDYNKFIESLPNNCKWVEKAIAKNEPVFRAWFEAHKYEDIDVCDPANALHCHYSNSGFDFDEMRGYTIFDEILPNGDIKHYEIWD